MSNRYAKRPNSSVIRRFLSLAIVLISASVYAEKNVSNDYMLWKDTHFHRFFVHKNADFSKYKKIAFLPMNYSSTIIYPKTKKRLKLSWKDFIETEMPAIATRFNEEVQSQLSENRHFSSTMKGDDDVLIVSFTSKEIRPKTYLDNGLTTVGKSTLTLVGYLTYQVVMMDGKTREIVAMIEDDHTIAPNTRATGEQPNNLGNQRRAWSTSMRDWVKRFFQDLQKLHDKTL